MRRTLGRGGRRRRRFPTVATTFAQAFGARQAAEAVQAAVEAIGLGAYRFDRYKSRVRRDGAQARHGRSCPARVGREGGQGGARGGRGRRRTRCCWARDLVNTPAGRPPAGRARARGAGDGEGRSGSPARSGPRPSSRQGGFGGILGVGQGLGEPSADDRAHATRAPAAPRRSRSPARASRSTPAGCRSRTPAGMETMKCDMGGAASILATMKVDRPAQAEGQRDRGDPVLGEHAERLGAEARRRHPSPRRHDERGAQHRRRRSAGPGRRARVPHRAEARAASSTPRRSPARAWSRSGPTSPARSATTTCSRRRSSRPAPRSASRSGRCRCGATTAR